MSILEVTVLKRVHNNTVEYIVTELLDNVERGSHYKRFDEVLDHLADIDSPMVLKIDVSVY